MLVEAGLILERSEPCGREERIGCLGKGIGVAYEKGRILHRRDKRKPWRSWPVPLTTCRRGRLQIVSWAARRRRHRQLSGLGAGGRPWAQKGPTPSAAGTLGHAGVNRGYHRLRVLPHERPDGRATGRKDSRHRHKGKKGGCGGSGERVRAQQQKGSEGGAASKVPTSVGLGRFRAAGKWMIQRTYPFRGETSSR